MKRASRDRFRPLRITALSQMFRLLDVFSKTKNSYAPTIYKALAMSLVENHADATTREYIMNNLEQIFESQPTIPVGFVVEPLVNQLQMAEGVSYHYNSVDFQFFVTIAKHPKLLAQQAIPLIDILAKIYLNDQAYAQCCNRPLMMLISRFINDQGIREFLVKFMTVSLSMLLALEKGKSAKKVKIPTTMNMNKRNEPKQSKEEKEITRSLKKTFIIEIARKIQQLRHPHVNNEMKSLVLSTNKRNNEIHGKDNVGCLVLLKYWGDPKAMIDKFMEEEEERERKEKEEMEKNQQLMLADEENRGNISSIEGVNHNNSMDLVPYEGKHSAYGVRMSRDSKRGQLIPWIKKQPKGKIGRKAMLEIEKLQKNRKDREEFKKLKEKQLRMKDERSKKKLADELEKRKIEYGVNAMNKKTTDRKIIFDEGEVDQFKKNEKKSGLPEIELFDFEEEEERDVDAIKIFMKKYSKLWRFYFNKYANMCFSGKHIRNFDQLNAKHNTINLAELIKLLHDHDLGKEYLTKEELSAIIRLVNFKKIHKSDLTALTYAGFLEWIVQTAIYMFTKPPEDLSHFPPVEALYNFLRKLEKAQKAKGGSTILFEDPDATGIGDTTLLKALNKKIKEDPNYPIPEDYKKVKEKQIQYDYRIPDYIPIDDTKKFAMEFLDNLIFEKFGFHYLEPIIEYKETLKVKPIIRKQFNNESGRATPRYLQSLDKRTKPKELNDKGKMSAYQKMRDEKKKPINLNETLSLEVAKVDKADRPRVKEAAELLEEILQSVAKGYKELPNRAKYGPIGMKNPVILDKIQHQKDEKKLQKEREQKRKKRDDQIKSIIKKKEEEKQKHLEETKDERKKQREDKKRRKQELKAKRDKEREDRQKEFQDKKKEELELLEQKQKEDEQKELEKKQNFEKENKQFLKDQAKKIRKDFKQTIQEKRSIQEAEKEVQEMESRLREQTKKKMEKHFEEHKESLHQDKEEKVAINKFVEKKAVKEVFQKYDEQLKYYYDYYAKQVYHELTRDIDNEFSTINSKEFTKFAYEFNIIPTIVPIHEVVYIFNTLVRERNDEDPTTGQKIDYEYFKKAIVRISAVGQKLLGGQKGELLEKKMEKETADKEKKDKLKETLAKKSSLKETSPKRKKEKDEDDDLDRKENSDEDDNDEKNKTKKKHNQGSLVERGAKPPRKKVQLPNPKEEKLKNATLIKGKFDENQLLNRKSLGVNKLLEIDEKAKVLDHLKHVKIESSRVTTECDVSLITDKTIEALLKYIGLDPEDNRFDMDKKLNSKRLDIQGIKPNKFKMKNVPDKADVISKAGESEEEEENDAKSDKGSKNDKKKDEEEDDAKSDKDDK